MLDFKVFCTKMRRVGAPEGNYTQYFIDGTSEIDAKERVRIEFGPGWELIEISGPFDHLEAKQ